MAAAGENSHTWVSFKEIRCFDTSARFRRHSCSDLDLGLVSVTIRVCKWQLVIEYRHKVKLEDYERLKRKPLLQVFLRIQPTSTNMMDQEAVAEGGRRE